MKKYIYRYILIFYCLLIVNNSNAQDSIGINKNFKIQESDWKGKKEISLNMTELLHKFVPFNLGKANEGFIGLRTKFYDRKYAFRVNFGASIIADRENSFAYGSFGYERRRIVANRWAYTSGWDMFASKGIFSEDPDETLLGFTRHYCIEYYINSKCYISTDAQLLIGIGTTAAFKFSYPNSIYFNIRL